MNCKFCGYTIKPDQQICPNCGTKLSPTQPSQGGTMVFESVREKKQKKPTPRPQPAKTKKSNNAAVAVLSCLLAIMVVVCVILTLKVFNIFPFVEETTTTTTESTTVSPYEAMFEYETYGDNITITKYIGSESSVIIPTEINGKKVTKIGDRAFYQSYFLRTLIIQSSVVEIGEQAFAKCSYLEAVTLSDSLRKIGDQAFYGCTVLTYIILPSTISDFGSFVFGDCVSLTVECSLTSEAYRYCKDNAIKYRLKVGEVETTKREENTIPPGLENQSGIVAVFNTREYLDGVEITGCNYNISTINIPEAIDGKPVLSIGEFAFSNNSNVTKIVIPSGIKNIGKYAFSYCTSLATVEIESKDVVINEGAFLHSNSGNVRFSVYKDSTAENYAKVHSLPYSFAD